MDGRYRLTRQRLTRQRRMRSGGMFPGLRRGVLLSASILALALLDGCQSPRTRRSTARRPAALPAAGPAEMAPGLPAAGPAGEPALPAPPVAEPPAIAQAPAQAPEVRPARPRAEPALPAPAAGSRVQSPQDVLRMLSQNEEFRGRDAAELVKQARYHHLNFEPLKAQEKLELALRLDPQNEEAQRLLAQVRTELGDYRGETAQVLESLAASQQASTQQTQTEIRILIQDGERFESEQDYDRAIRNYERAIETIRGFPYILNLDEELRRAARKLEDAKRLKVAKDERDRIEFEKKIGDIRNEEKRTSLAYIQNKIDELYRQAQEAYNREEYENAQVYAERILELYPEHPQARGLKLQAAEAKFIKDQYEIYAKTFENSRYTLLDLHESSIIYQQIFRYPPRKEWERITPKLVSLEQQLEERESSLEKEIKRKLLEPQDIAFTEPVPFGDAIQIIRQISGLTIVLNNPAREQLASSPAQVRLARVRELPLENVLRLLLQQIDPPFDYMIEEGAILIGPKDSIQKHNFLWFYDVHDIVQARPDFKAPPLALDELAGQEQAPIFEIGGGDEVRGGGTVQEDLLQSLVEKEITVAGDIQGTVKYQRGKLAVKTTLENHRKISQLLEKLREASGVMVTVESRFLELQDNFLEQIGIDIGSTGNTFLLNSIPDIDGAGTSISPGYEFTNAQQDFNLRGASIGGLSNPLGSRVNPFNISAAGGGAYQLNVLTEAYQLEAILTGVAKEQEIRKLSSPRVTAFNTQIAHTLVINQAAYIQDLEVNQTGVIPVINPVIGVLNSGSILEVRPNVSHDRRYVVLEIQPTLAEKLDSDVAVLNLSGQFTVVPVELPVLSVTKIKTTVTVPDGGTVLVGGLRREIQNKASIGIPGLRHIPILNILFGRKGQSHLRSSLFVLINAKITIVQEEEERLFNI